MVNVTCVEFHKNGMTNLLHSNWTMLMETRKIMNAQTTDCCVQIVIHKQKHGEIKHEKMVGVAGLEPALPWSRTRWSSRSPTHRLLVAGVGFEPTTTGV